MGLFLFYQISGVFSFWGHKIRGWVFVLFNIPLIQTYKWGTHGWQQASLLFNMSLIWTYKRGTHGWRQASLLFNMSLIWTYKWGTHGWQQVFLLFSVPWMKSSLGGATAGYSRRGCWRDGWGNQASDRRKYCCASRCFFCARSGLPADRRCK